MRRLPMVFLVASCVLLVLGVLPGAPAGGLMMAGMEGDRALEVGVQLGNGLAVLGLGLLLLGMGLLLRQNRVEQAWSSYWRALDGLASDLRAEWSTPEGRSLSLSVEIDGLPMVVRVDLSGEGEVLVRAALPAQQRFEVRRRNGGGTPHRLEHRLATAGLEEVAVGNRWEARSDGGPRVVQVIQTPALVRAVDSLFLLGSVRSFAQDGATATVRSSLVEPGEIVDIVRAAVAVLLGLRAASE